MPDPQPTRDPAREEGQQAADEDVVARETERAAAQAAQIGGRTGAGPPDLDEAQRPVVEAGEGEAEGFEQAEQDLIEHASHGDQHGARRAIEDAPEEEDDVRATAGAEADFERSSEHEDAWGR